MFLQHAVHIQRTVKRHLHTLLCELLWCQVETGQHAVHIPDLRIIREINVIAGGEAMKSLFPVIAPQDSQQFLLTQSCRCQGQIHDAALDGNAELHLRHLADRVLPERIRALHISVVLQPGDVPPEKIKHAVVCQQSGEICPGQALRRLFFFSIFGGGVHRCHPVSSRLCGNSLR